MQIQVVILCLAAAYASAQSGGYGSYGHHGHHDVDYYAPPHYNFHYEVHDEHTGDIKYHKEERKDDHTQGEYSVVEPDGSRRTIHYTVEGKHGGFNAHVQRDHNQHVYHHQPLYHQQPIYHHQPVYHHQPTYHRQPSYQHGGQATSSVSFATHGAHITTSTHHGVPHRNHY